MVDLQHDDRDLLIPCVIASDLSEQVITSRLKMTCFQKYLEKNQLDFVIMDTNAIMREKDTKRFYRIYQQRYWSYDTLDPVFIIGNYFLDSLPSDAWILQHDTACTLYETCVSADVESAKDVECTLRPYHGDAYENPLIEKTFRNVVSRAIASKPSLSLSLIVFPIHSLEFLIQILGIKANSPSPRGFIFGDTRCSFRDPFKSFPYIELPQLSPTPDCFCLAVDFEILQAFFDELRDIPAWLRLDSNVANDTFDICTGSIHVEERDRVRVYTTLQSTISPCDFDLLHDLLLHGTLNGILYDFKLETLLALLIHSGFDYELFLLVQWNLYRKWKQQQNEQIRKRICEIGWKCYQMRYEMDSNAVISVGRQNVQMTRWLKRKWKTPFRMRMTELQYVVLKCDHKARTTSDATYIERRDSSGFSRKNRSM